LDGNLVKVSASVRTGRLVMDVQSTTSVRPRNSDHETPDHETPTTKLTKLRPRNSRNSDHETPLHRQQIGEAVIPANVRRNGFASHGQPEPAFRFIPIEVVERSHHPKYRVRFLSAGSISSAMFAASRARGMAMWAGVIPGRTSETRARASPLCAGANPASSAIDRS
jgi:hypothetical protein